jgi:hypothetical protein
MWGISQPLEFVLQLDEKGKNCYRCYFRASHLSGQMNTDAV